MKQPKFPDTQPNRKCPSIGKIINGFISLARPAANIIVGSCDIRSGADKTKY